MNDRKADRRFLQRVGMDVLFRSLQPREVRDHLDAPETEVVRRLYGSREAMDVWLEEELLYFLLLDNFRPRNDAVEDIPRRLHNEELHVRDAIAEIMLSTGFNLRNPGNDTFVTVVLEQCLGMKVQSRKGEKVLEAGKKIYDGRPGRFLGETGASQADIIKIVTRQREFMHFVLDRHHQRLLGGALPEDDAAVDRVHEDPKTFFAQLQDWILSDAYHDALAVRRRKSDHQFVRSLYIDLLGRLPSGEELRNMRNAMLSMADPSALRAVMAKVILDSGKARLPRLERDGEEAFVDECFLLYLCRKPGEAERKAFVTAIREDDAKPSMIARALVSSAEYQYYCDGMPAESEATPRDRRQGARPSRPPLDD